MIPCNGKTLQGIFVGARLKIINFSLMEITMHTQITLDDQLFQQAVELTGLKNPQDLIETVLREFLNQHDQQEELAFTIACQQTKE